MNYLKTVTVVFFLLISGLGEYGFPNFALIVIFLWTFIADIARGGEISWMSGFSLIALITSLIIISFSRGYKDRYKLVIAFLILFAFETYTSEILQHQKLLFWFVFPSLVFIASSLALIIKSFRSTQKRHL